MRTLVTGATGFVGRRLLRHLDNPVALSRQPEKARAVLAEFAAEVYPWQAQDEPAPADAFRGVKAVVHLAGEPVAQGRWTRAKKARLRASRVAGTRNLVGTLAGLDRPPKVLVSASAVGFYGSRGAAMLDESASPGDDFLAELCREWEAEAQKAADCGVRVVSVRIGIVLGEKGGALARMITPFRMGFGGRLGSGTQWVPWIHIDDLVGILWLAIRSEDLHGPVNAVAPHPVTNGQFTRTLGGILRRPTVFPMPAPLLRLLLGEFADVLLASQRVVPKVAQAFGYTFQYPELEAALRAILKP